uniref:Uncharacterized protein n=1 Tax=Anguilla anguilla TaxID=7936 RepID=A0A0E9PZ78_ANGAN
MPTCLQCYTLTVAQSHMLRNQLSLMFPILPNPSSSEKQPYTALCCNAEKYILNQTLHGTKPRTI